MAESYRQVVLGAFATQQPGFWDFGMCRGLGARSVRPQSQYSKLIRRISTVAHKSVPVCLPPSLAPGTKMKHCRAEAKRIVVMVVFLCAM